SIFYFLFLLLFFRWPSFSTLFPYTTLFRSLVFFGVFLVVLLGLVSFLVFVGIAFGRLGLRGLSVLLFGRLVSRASAADGRSDRRSEEHTSELQSHLNLVCRLLLEKNTMILL